MLFELPPVWTVLLNLTAWLAIHLGVAWAGTRAPKRLFDPAHPLYRIRSWERKSSFYERLLGIRSWKDRLPDWGGRFRGGFFKKSLETSSPEYLQRFILEIFFKEFRESGFSGDCFEFFQRQRCCPSFL